MTSPNESTQGTDPRLAAAFSQAETAAAFLKDINQSLPEGPAFPSKAKGDRLRAELTSALSKGDISAAVNLLYELQYNAQGHMVITVFDENGHATALLDPRFKQQFKSDPRTGLADEDTRYQNFAAIGLAYVEAAKQLLRGNGSLSIDDNVDRALNKLAATFVDRMQHLDEHYTKTKGKKSPTTVRAQAELAKLLDDGLVPLLQANAPKLKNEEPKAIRQQLAEVRDFANFKAPTRSLGSLARTQVNEAYQETDEVKKHRVAEKYHVSDPNTVYIDTLEIDTPIPLPKSFIGKYYGNSVADLDKQDWFKLLKPHIQDAIRFHYAAIVDGKHIIPTQLRAYLPGYRNMYHKEGLVLGSEPSAQAQQFHDAYHSGSSSHDFSSENKDAIKEIKTKAREDLSVAKKNLAVAKRARTEAGAALTRNEATTQQYNDAIAVVQACEDEVKRLQARIKNPVAAINAEMTKDAMQAQADVLQINAEQLFIVSLLSPGLNKNYIKQLYQAQNQGVGNVAVLAQNFMRHITLSDVKKAKLLTNYCSGIFNKVCNKNAADPTFTDLLEQYEKGHKDEADKKINELLSNYPTKARQIKEMLQLLALQRQHSSTSSLGLDSTNHNLEQAETLKRLGSLMNELGDKDTTFKFVSQCLSGKDRDGILSFRSLIGGLVSFITGGRVQMYQGKESDFDKQSESCITSHIEGNTARIPKAQGGSIGMEGAKSDSEHALPAALRKFFKRIGQSIIHDEASFNKKAPEHPVDYHIKLGPIKLFEFKLVAKSPDSHCYRDIVATVTPTAITSEPTATSSTTPPPAPITPPPALIITPSLPVPPTGPVTSVPPTPTPTPTTTPTTHRPG